MRWPAFAGVIALAATVSIYRAVRPVARPAPVSAQTQRLRHLRALQDSILAAELREGLVARATRLSPVRHGIVGVSEDRAGTLHPLPDSAVRILDSVWARYVPAEPKLTTVLIEGGSGWKIIPGSDGNGTQLCAVALWPGFLGPTERQIPYWIGPCTWYARYGAPGAAIAAWLQRTGVGWRAVPPRFVSTDSTPAQYGLWYRRLHFVAGLTGTAPPAYDAAPAAIRCSQGGTAACALAATAPDGSASYESFWGAMRGMGSYQGYLLRDLFHDFGPDRVGVFWRSSAPVPEAFQSAFGVPVSEWLGPHLRDYLGAVELGAGDLRGASLSALIWVLLIGGLCWWAARRLRY